MFNMNMCVRALGAGMGVLVCASAFGQAGIGPSLGTVELRWRERSTAGYNGSYTLGPGAVAGVDAIPTPDPSAASVTAQDANVVLVLEARVTRTAGIAGPSMRGLFAAGFDIATNQTSGGAFGRQLVPDSVPTINPRGNAKLNETNLGFDPATLLDYPTGGIARGLVSPYRRHAVENGGLNGPGLGHFASGTNTISKVTAGLQTGNLEPLNIDATHPGQYELAGLNEWVPIYIAVYNITDVTTARDIVFTVKNSDSGNPFQLITDYNFRTWRGQSNSQNGGLDLWQMTPGFTTAPTFTVHVVPGPGIAGVMGFAGLVVMARRRRV